jgi:hypothetical protein
MRRLPRVFAPTAIAVLRGPRQLVVAGVARHEGDGPDIECGPHRCTERSSSMLDSLGHSGIACDASTKTGMCDVLFHFAQQVSNPIEIVNRAETRKVIREFRR